MNVPKIWKADIREVGAGGLVAGACAGGHDLPDGTVRERGLAHIDANHGTINQ